MAVADGSAKAVTIFRPRQINDIRKCDFGILQPKFTPSNSLEVMAISHKVHMTSTKVLCTASVITIGGHLFFSR